MKTRQGRRCSLSRCVSLYLAQRQGAAQGGPESRGTHFYTSLTTGQILLKSLRNWVIDNLRIKLLHCSSYILVTSWLNGEVKNALKF